MYYLLSKTTKREIERLLMALSARRADVLKEINDSRRARLMLSKLNRLKNYGVD